MPEICEVETIRCVLKNSLINKKITAVSVEDDKVVFSPDTLDFCEGLAGQTIKDFTRRGKFLRLIFASEDYLTIHLKMTGAIFIQPQNSPVDKHTHIIIKLDNDSQLLYNDVRKLGGMWFTKRGEKDVSGVDKLGLEPFDADQIKQRFKLKQHSRKPIKSMLLDQTVIAGIGNIYSDEILFSAGILPNKPCYMLSCKEWDKLCQTIPDTINFFIEKNQITLEEYLASLGRDYRNTPYLQVYGKSGSPCHCCGTVLTKTVIGGRSSVFCPQCQR